MDTQSIWKMLADIKIGTLVAWCIVIAVIITTITKGVKNIYTYIKKYNTLKEDNEKQTQIIKDHEETLTKINECLSKINKSLDEQKDINLKYCRHIIVRACHDVIVAGNMQIEQLASIEEMYEEYVNVFHGNSYVSGLVARVRKLPIIDYGDDLPLGDTKLEYSSGEKLM